jgi:hypothetical protein
MKKPGDYLMKRYLGDKAQATIEFSLAFVTAILFLVLTCNLFVWLNHTLVRRQRAYEESRVIAAKSSDIGGDPGRLNFYTRQTANLFTLGGYQR